MKGALKLIGSQIGGMLACENSLRDPQVNSNA
jgi:hypothetical protein